MIENHRIKRGLLRLGEATVSELSSFAECERGAVVRFLEGSPDIVERVAAERWHLLPRGQERLRSELAGLRDMSTPDLDAERAQVGKRLRGSMRQILATLDALEERFDPTDPEDVLACERVGRRIRATRASTRKLDAARDRLELEIAYLDDAEKRLARVSAAADEEALEAPIADRLNSWSAGLIAALGESTPEQDRFVPEKAEAGPVVIVETASSLHGLTETMVDAARSANALVLRLRLDLDDKSGRTKLLEALSEQVATAIGTAARVVFTMDSRHPGWATLVEEFEKFESDRSRLRPTILLSPSDWDASGGSSKWMRSCLVHELARGVVEQEEDTVEQYFFRSLVTHMVERYQEGQGRVAGTHLHRWPHVRSVYVDAADVTPSRTHFEDDGVVVFGFEQLRRQPYHGMSVIEPLPLTKRAAPSPPAQRAWRAVFVPAVVKGNE